MTPEYALIREAILTEKNIRATYDDCAREMCPHILGRKNRQEKVLMYQYAGESISGLGEVGSSANWRCLFVRELSDVEIIDGPWYTAASKTMPSSCVDSVDVEVPAWKRVSL